MNLDTYERLKKLITHYNNEYFFVIDKLKNSTSNEIDHVKLVKIQLIRDYREKVEQFIYDELNTLTNVDVELLDLIPNVVYRGLKEKTRIMINEIYNKK